MFASGDAQFVVRASRRCHDRNHLYCFSLLLSALAPLGLVASPWVAPILKGRLRYSALKI